MPTRTRYHRPRHQAAAAARYETADDRLAAKRFYASAAWVRTRLVKLRADPLCGPCLARGEVTAAVQVHHKEERRERPDLAFDMDNLESVCIPCHNAKRAE